MVAYAQRLSNLSQTDLAPLLPLPIVAEPRDASDEAGPPPQMHHDPSVLQEVVALLRACDNVSLIPKLPASVLSSGSGQFSELQQAVLKLDPNALATGSVGYNGSNSVPAVGASFTCSVQSIPQAPPSIIAGSEAQVTHEAPLRRKRQRSSPDVEAAEIDELDVFKQRLLSFLAKQQHNGSQQTEDDTETAEPHDIVDVHYVQLTSLHELKDLNMRLSKLVQTHQLRLVELAQLLELLDAMERLMQHGEALLVEHDPQDHEEQEDAIVLSLEACAACLHILSAPSMPKQVYKEELIDKMVGLIKYHLLKNVLVFYDAGICQANRPSLLEQGEEWAIVEAQGPSRKKTSKAKRAPSLSIPAAARAIQARLEGILQLMGALLKSVQLQASTLLPFLRIACQSLTVEGIDLLQIKAAGLLVSAFQNSPQLQSHLLEEILTRVMPTLPMGKRCHRAYVVGDSTSAAVQVTTAMLVQMVQASVHLPSDVGAGDEGSDLRDCFALAVAHSDRFWHGCFDRFPTAKAAKSDTEVDPKQVVEHIIQDLLRVQELPTWPAASTLLLRCMSTLGGQKGLQHSDVSVRQISIDLLGVIATHLHKDMLSAEGDQEWLSQLMSLEGDKPAVNIYMVSQHLLLDYLADQSQQRDAALAESARSFLVCRMFVDELSSNHASGLSTAKLHQSDLLVQYKKIMQQADKGTSCDLEAEDSGKVARAVVQHGPLGRGCQTLLMWLLEAADSTKQAQASTRAKAIKALGLVAEIDPSLLAKSTVQLCINKALQDESVSVREAAVDLLGKHISARQDLALAYFDILATAVRDLGTSVRKRAINIMWESCIQQPGFQRASDACVHILGRISDSEESIQKLVSKIFHSLWFSGTVQNGNDAPQRAQQLADVAGAVYEARARGSGIYLPLEPTHPLLSVIKQALAKETDSHTGQRLAAALLDNILQAVDAAQGSQEADSFPDLLALHAFCLADVTLCMSSNDPARFVRCLAPYLKVPPMDKDTPIKDKRRAAERTLCILSVLTALLGSLDRLPAALAQEMEADLCQLIESHQFVQVVGAAAQTLCALATLSPTAKQRLSGLLQQYMLWLQDKSTKLLNTDSSPIQLQSHVAATCRIIYSMGQLIRHSATQLQTEAETDDPKTAEIQQLLTLLVLFYNLKPGQISTRDALKLREKALEGLGLLFIVHPAALMESTASAAMQSALRMTSASCLKLKALTNLLELLKSEEEQLQGRQGETAKTAMGPDPNGQAAAAGLTFLTTLCSCVELHKCLHGATQSEEEQLQGRQGETAKTATCPDPNGQEVAGLTVPVQNGEGDSLNLSAGFIQANWEAIKALALDTSPAQQLMPSTPSHDPNQSAAQVRRRAQEVMEAVLRGGVMPPFSAIPTLFALATDPNRDIAVRALSIVQREAQRHSAVRSQLAGMEGMQAAALFQEGLREPHTPGQLPCTGLNEASAQGMAALYTHVLQLDRNIRMPFLRAVLRSFDTAADLLTTGAATANLRLLAFAAHMLANLPFKKCDEPYTVVHSINAVISRRGAFVLGAMKTALEAAPSEAAAEPAADSNAQDETTPDADAAEQQALLLESVPVQPRKIDKAGPEAACTASLALTMLLLLKDFLKETYGMSDERIAAFSPDLPDKRKQEERTPAIRQENVKLRIQNLRINARHDPALRKEQYKVFKYLLQHDSSDNGQGPVIIRSNSRKKSRVDPEALQGEAALRGPDVEVRTLEERSASGGALFTADLVLEHQNSAGVKSRGTKGQCSTTGRGKDAKPKSRAITQSRKKRKAVKYIDSQDIDGDAEEMYDDHNDDDFVAPSRTLARKVF